MQERLGRVDTACTHLDRIPPPWGVGTPGADTGAASLPLWAEPRLGDGGTRPGGYVLI